MVATQRLRAATGPEEGWTEIPFVRVAPNRFKLQRQLQYEHERYGSTPFVFPSDPDTFTTDMASVPRLLAWFVPLIGTHLPATLLHDALVVGRDDEGELEPPTHIGPTVSRLEADRLYRDAMYYTGTSLIRRNLIWAGVVWATLFDAANPRIGRGEPGRIRRLLRVCLGIPRITPLLLFWPVHRSERDSTRGLQRGRLLGLSLLGLFLILPTLALVPFVLAGALLDWLVSKAGDDGRGIDVDRNLDRVETEVQAGAS